GGFRSRPGALSRPAPASSQAGAHGRCGTCVDARAPDTVPADSSDAPGSQACPGAAAAAHSAFLPPSRRMKLTAHVLDGHTLDVRPAPRERTWMDATDQRYAYRCLPLDIANAHGWELLC